MHTIFHLLFFALELGSDIAGTSLVENPGVVGVRSTWNTQMCRLR
jgi:hypothetical protein